MYEFVNNYGGPFRTTLIIFNHDIDLPSVDAASLIDLRSGEQHSVFC